MKRILLILIVISSSISFSQSDADALKTIYKQSLTNGESYQWLDHLSNQIGSRLSGSLGAERAVAYTKKELEKLGLDKVWLQPVMVPKWVRGAKEYAFIEGSSGKTTSVNICALGGSVATPALGLKAEVVEVKTFEELEALGTEQIKGKIVFFNRAMQADLIHTFEAYGGCVNQRYSGFKQNCKQLKDVQSYNVIGQITGSEFPEEYMVVGGHLDSWDLGDGSHDDGAGVVQSMEVLRLLKVSGITPKRSIRVVLFMNEENGLRGGKKYAAMAKQNNENHVFALESDSGGFTPRGFSFDCNDAAFSQVLSWQSLFKPYLIHYFEKGGSGADVGPLKTDTNVLAGLRPDSQRYFDHHHASNDTFDAVNKRELELGAATMTALIYLFDTYGVNPISNPAAIKN